MTDKQVAIFGEGVIDKQYFELLPTGLVVKNNPPFEKWERVGIALQQMERAVQWWLGDWLNHGERAFGEKYSQALEVTEYTYMTLAQFSFVARHVDFLIRIKNLSFYHHQLVADMEPEQQKHWLKLAELEGWSVHTLRKMIKVSKEEKEEPEVYCYISDKLECLAQHYYKAFLLESNPKEDRYVWLPGWDDKCRGSCLALGLCRDAVAAMTSSEQFKEMTVNINKKERGERERENG